MEFTQEKAMQLEAILKNSEFVNKAAKLTTAEELQALIASYGLELTMEEVIGFCELVAKEKEKMDNNGGELSEEALDDVAGGGVLFILGCVGLGVVAVGGLACGIYNGYKGNA